MITYTNHAFGIWNIGRKLQKNTTPSIFFSLSTPKICFLWKDKGEYIKLSYRLRINVDLLDLQIYTTLFCQLNKGP
jgi:hypothetical protein